MKYLFDRGRLPPVLGRSWQSWLLAIAVIIIVGDAALHLFGREGTTTPSARPGSAAPTVRAEPPPPMDVKLNAEQRAAAGIIVEPVSAKPHAEIFRAPGEIRVNDYATSNVSSRLRATVLTRQAKLGDAVRKNQRLATLYSAEMAEAESAFVLASKNYVRMSNLKDYISGQQFDEAEVKRDEARGRLQSFGLGASEIERLATRGLGGRTAGQFELAAPQDGVITADAFREGEVIEPGKTLFEISNLSNVWVEAQVSPAIAPRVAGDKARVTVGGKTYDAKIVQTLELLNKTTRTVGIRLQVVNAGGALKPGTYVDVELFSASVSEIFVPTVALLRDGDGSWLVYIENADGVFQPTRVEPLHVAGDETAISGIPDGARVATAGAFFVKSEADKSSFAAED